MKGSDYLSEAERKAIQAFVDAAKALPKSIYISVDDVPEPGYGHLVFWKCESRGSAVLVCHLRKKSLVI